SSTCLVSAGLTVVGSRMTEINPSAACSNDSARFRPQASMPRSAGWSKMVKPGEIMGLDDFPTAASGEAYLTGTLSEPAYPQDQFPRLTSVVVKEVWGVYVVIDK